MTRINVNEFNHFSRELLEEFLIISGGSQFAIVIPREYIGPTMGDCGCLAVEFSYFAYAGFILDQAVENFAYNVPDPFSNEPVVFKVNAEDIAAFSDALFKMIAGTFNNPDDLTAHTNFSDEAYKFYTDFVDEGTVPATIGLLGAAYHLCPSGEE